MKDQIQKDIQEAITKLNLGDFAIPEIIVEEPKAATFGEYTSNIALILAKFAKKAPLALAEMIAQELSSSESYAVEAVAPGYLNFTLSNAVLIQRVSEIIQKQGEYGTPEKPGGKKINNEFISANPTGPLHIGNGRGGYFGDSLTRLLRKMGHQVTSEYYINDGGEQVVKLGHSVLQDEEAVYGGEYIQELHKRLGKSGTPESVGQEAARIILEESIKKTVTENMGITYNVWTSEREMLSSGLVAKAVDILIKGGHTFEAEGALWLRTTDFGDDKDRVLKKSDGSYTYFASDAGHILSYLERGVEVILETFGADHHGYTKRFEAVARALGFQGELHFTLMQLVKLEKDGAPVRMSKRAGNVVGIDELIEVVGRDVARFFFLMYSPDTHMTFDLGLAEERSQKNPVFYVQYAHARMASIGEKANEQNLTPKVSSAFTHPKERELARELYYYPEFLERAAQDYAPHRLAQYALGLADLFHSFYGAAQVLDENHQEQSEHRLALVSATRVVLAETLRLLGITAPEKM